MSAGGVSESVPSLGDEKKIGAKKRFSGPRAIFAAVPRWAKMAVAILVAVLIIVVVASSLLGGSSDTISNPAPVVSPEKTPETQSSKNQKAKNKKKQ